MKRARRKHGRPIYVDLDGSLLRSNLLYESTIALLKQNLLFLFVLPFWLRRGRACLKARIASRVSLRFDLLPYNDKVIAYLRQEKEKGRVMILATASNVLLAQGVRDFLGLFDAVIASDSVTNLKGCRKLAKIHELQRGEEFDYVGDSRADRDIFRAAHTAIVVNPSKSLIRYVAMNGNLVQIAPEQRLRVLDLLRSIRLHQWIKNILIFIPLITSHSWFVEDKVLAILLGFMSFGLCASSIYLLNDLFDLEADRAHSRKKFRPLASGVLGIPQGVMLLVVLMSLGLWIAAFIDADFLIVLTGYVLLTVAYTLLLKRIVLVDVFVLATLYTLRVVAGAAAIHVELSFWLLAFSMFLFTSLSLLKRCSELLTINQQERKASIGRDYRVSDQEQLQVMGIVSGYLAVFVVAFYINDPRVATLYSNQRMLWLVCPLLLYWISRMWLKTARGEMHADPIVYALKDRTSILIAAGILVIIIGSI